MPVHTLDNCSMSYGIYSTNGIIPGLSAPGYMTTFDIESLVSPLIGKQIWGVSTVHKKEALEIESSQFISNEIKSFKLKRTMFTITFLPFIFDRFYNFVENGRLFYGQLAYNILMETLDSNQLLLFGDNAGWANYINPDYCLAVELMSVNTEIDDAGNRIVTAEFQQKFLGNFPY
ncbi:MAG: hypothetical protein NTW25_00205 [Candidatus Kapabacteria bacterium]|nr:hypothetical protein [Candidatus Kapabacteria bacterium]